MTCLGEWCFFSSVWKKPKALKEGAPLALRVTYSLIHKFIFLMMKDIFVRNFHKEL